MNKKLLPLLIALAIATSGCLSMPADDPEPIDSDNEDDPHGHGNGDHGSEDDGKEGNETSTEPPTAELTADVTNGTAPLNVTFALDGEHPDGGNLSWVLDLGDGNSTEGDDLPATYEHSFTDAGNFTVILTVSDGTLEGTAQVDVEVTLETWDGMLYLVGDGSNVIITEDHGEIPEALDGEADGTTFSMHPDGPGSESSTYVTWGPWSLSAWNNIFVPTFLYDGPVSLTGETIRLVVHVDFPFPANSGADDDLCPLGAHLFDAEGNSLIGEDNVMGMAAAEPGSFEEVIFEFDLEAGEYSGLGVQFGSYYSDCSVVPAEWIWGDEDHPGRLELAPGDRLL